MQKKSSDLSRRDFARLSMAAFGGMVIGTTGLAAFAADDKDKPEMHVCRGLNTCKNQGSTKMNECAGQGKCATADKHTCSGENACKGQGGCGAHPGENACKGKGECSVPLGDDSWKKARAKFEESMKKAGKKFGDAPPK